LYNKLRVAALIPARGGSKSVPYKNLYPVGGKPLVAWPIETAIATPEIDDIYVSTDDDRISSCALKYGVRIHHRPAELASDTALVADTVRHLYAMLVEQSEQIDVFVLLEATSPFRTPEMIRRCLKRMVDEDLDSIATFHRAEINPWRTWRITDGEPSPFIPDAIPWLPRQQLPDAYQLNGAVYAFRPGRLPADSPRLLFGKIGAEIVDSNDVIDIDEQKDFAIANAILLTQDSAKSN
jgi:CMP-N-acetylneuraminic acid synthetase